ncbi:flagellar protein FliT [Trinickia dinghuensis]|uniref:Flagellar protein FliT n=1 Tax=Trinickia dinghuensis TaxID=2291023 RepID=A0A3D8K0G4_9BURK|nr:flagellar protein FliT [Trinickia dinghuensis]RDU98384.1 flagellar protein FliT [Trinickia dinghuensis]
MSNESLARAYELTRTLVAALDAGDFAFAADLAEERSPLLMSLQRDQTDEDLATIREIMAMNASIVDRASAARDAVAATHTNARERVSAARQYLAAGQMR